MDSIESILLDADGVVQMPAPEWREQLEKLAGNVNRADQFMSEIFDAERTCITGHQNFATALQTVMQRWQCNADVEEVLDLWTMIEPNAAVLQMVGELRDQGHRVYLATNQHKHRANYMAKVLGYDEMFDGAIYSCDLGVAKPERAYFIELIERLGLKSTTSLFIDDKDANVAVARQVGLHAEQFHLMEGVEALRRTLRYYDIRVTGP